MKQIVFVQGITNTGKNTPRCYAGIKKLLTLLEDRNLKTEAIFGSVMKSPQNFSFLR